MSDTQAQFSLLKQTADPAVADAIRELIENGADLIITTGGMSVDPDDVTRFAIRRLGATDITYG